MLHAIHGMEQAGCVSPNKDLHRQRFDTLKQLVLFLKVIELATQRAAGIAKPRQP